MEKNDLNASSFAEAINVGRSSISHILSGRNKPSLDLVMNIVGQFPEVDLYWLLNGKGTYPKTEQAAAPPVSVIPPVTSTAPSTPKMETIPVEEKSNSTTPDLFSTTPLKNDLEVDKNNLGKSISKIIILYSDGSFKDYVPE